ncbi:MAG: hypothetical protein P8Z75_12935 [Gammaproteobacteria bacterium]|jgi:hypothetical protein
MRRYLTSLLILLLGYLTPALSRAQTLQVGLHIQSERLDLAYAQSVRNTDLSRLNLVWHEQLASWLDGTIHLGKFRLTQDSNPIPAGQATDGTTIGLGLRFHLYRGSRLDIASDLGYQYADSTASLSGQTVNMSWHQVSGQIQASIRLFSYSYLSLAAGALAIHGDERASGTITSVNSFHNNTSGFARAGLLLGLDRDSHIGIEVDTGAVTGGRIVFQRWF